MRRHDIDDVMELRADAARILDVAGPRHDHALPRAAEEGGHLLGPFEGGVEGPGPRHGHVRRGLVGAQDIVELQLRFDRNIDGLNRGEVEGRADGGAFGAGSVVAADVDDQRVIEFAQVFHRLNDPADLVVGVGDIGGEDIRLTDEHLFSSALSVSHFGRTSGHGVSWVFAGITPSFFWLAKICSRMSFQPLSKRCMSLIFLIHSGVG